MDNQNALAVAPPGEVERYQAQLRVADAVRSFVLSKKPNGDYAHLTRIGKGLHCNIEVWRAIAATAGYALGVTEVRQCGDGWEADGVVRRVSDGVIVGSGSGYCDAVEKFGQGKATYAIRGMAQTRAQSRAAAGVFGQLVVFIHEDLKATPAEEMTSVVEEEAPRRRPVVERKPQPGTIGAAPKAKPAPPHNPVTGEVIEADEKVLWESITQAPNATARAKLLIGVPPEQAGRIMARWRREHG